MTYYVKYVIKKTKTIKMKNVNKVIVCVVCLIPFMGYSHDITNAKTCKDISNIVVVVQNDAQFKAGKIDDIADGYTAVRLDLSSFLDYYGLSNDWTLFAYTVKSGQVVDTSYLTTDTQFPSSIKKLDEIDAGHAFATGIIEESWNANCSPLAIVPKSFKADVMSESIEFRWKTGYSS